MKRFFDYALRLSGDDEFLRFQHDVSQTAYGVLTKSYATIPSQGETEVVENLVNILSGMNYDQVRLWAGFIHGRARSEVSFPFRGTNVACELGDMVVISMVTDGSTRLVQRICLVQNKKAHTKRWGVIPRQLFLLKNFPPVTGTTGILRGARNLAFRNHSGCLGAYGFLHEPGEMVFSSARYVAEFLRGRDSMQISDVGLSPVGRTDVEVLAPDYPFWSLWHRPPDDRRFLQELRWVQARRSSCGWAEPYSLFLGNVHFCRDVCDFVRDWTQINIGEYTCYDGRIVNPDVDYLANRFLRRAGFDSNMDLPGGKWESDDEFDDNVGVLVARVDVEPKG